VERTFGVVEVRTGVCMPYVEQGDASGVPLLLVHAVGDSQWIFEGLLDHLPASVHGFAPTLRGHGDAGKPPSGYRSSDFAADIAAFLDAVHVERAVVAGASSGGLVAQRLALDFPDRVLALALLGSPLTFVNKPSAQALWESTIAPLTDATVPVFVRSFLADTLSQSASDELLDAAVQESLKVPAFVWRETMRGILDDDFRAELGSIAIPTLVAWGDADAVLPREDQEALASLIPGARWVVYSGAGHMFYWDDPARVAADLAAFATAAVAVVASAGESDKRLALQFASGKPREVGDGE
jgi:non-heme chloroperoxidase